MAGEPVIVTIPGDPPRQELGEEVAPGVAITPHSTEPGWWHLVHTPSGMSFTGLGAVNNYEALRRAGDDIGATGIDWTGDLDELAGDDASEGWPTARIIGELYRGAYHEDQAEL